MWFIVVVSILSEKCTSIFSKLCASKVVDVNFTRMHKN